MTEDILKRAKAILNINDDSQAWGDGVLSVIDELIAEVERLRSVAEARLQLNWTLSGECNELKQEIATKNARIKELEAVLTDMSRRAERLFAMVIDDEAYRNRIDAAFLKLKRFEILGYYPILKDNTPEVDLMAREALERIRSGDDE